ncbi:MAG: restriction endonuclease subunit S [Paludibacter sp.]|nr:restriction endonuclease subunit S [Paludibacter sp.]
MKTTLKHISSIQTGVFAKPNIDGDVVYLQAKHFSETGQLNSLLHPDLMSDAVSVKHLLNKGDVIFAAKGTKNFATVYNLDIPAVASTSFFVIRINENYKHSIIPEYLAWWMNQSFSQTFLKAQAIGTSIVSISKAVLEELEITIPVIHKQELILKINTLRNKEAALIKQLELLKEQQLQQQIINAIK